MTTTPDAEYFVKPHTGVVVLVGDRAYKGKKPITTDFLDHSTPGAAAVVRARGRAEPSAGPDTYLGVAHLSDRPAGPPSRSW